jgi:hypothetical protein
MDHLWGPVEVLDDGQCGTKLIVGLGVRGVVGRPGDVGRGVERVGGGGRPGQHNDPSAGLAE